jgi:hypothetical protein
VINVIACGVVKLSKLNANKQMLIIMFYWYAATTLQQAQHERARIRRQKQEMYQSNNNQIINKLNSPNYIEEKVMLKGLLASRLKMKVGIYL